MSIIEEGIEVRVSAHTAYNQWTQFEEFSKFMEGVVAIQQLDDRHLLWRTNIAGVDKTFEAEITEQIPDKRIAWRSVSGAPNAGVVTFHSLSPDMARIMLQMEYETKGVVEGVGDMLGITTHRIRGDLKRFKQFVESRGAETGAWRGKVDHNG